MSWTHWKRNLTPLLCDRLWRLSVSKWLRPISDVFLLYEIVSDFWASNSALQSHRKVCSENDAKYEG